MRPFYFGTLRGAGCHSGVKIRTHLLLLAAGALVPLLVFSTGLTAYSWWEQRRSVELRQLERVRAMTLALDTELQAAIRVMRVLALAPGTDPSNFATYLPAMRSVMGTQPLWSTLAVGDPAWTAPKAVDREGEAAAPRLEPGARERALQTRRPALSGVFQEQGHWLTEVVVPVLRDDAVAALVVVAIDQRQWLGFMSQYAMTHGSIMAMLDQDGRIIARTLNNDANVGRLGGPKIVAKSRESVEATFRNKTVEGEEMYAAHSRSVRWGWTMATGVPASVVESALFDSTAFLIGTALVSVGLAVFLAFFYGRRVARPMVDLGHAAHALAEGDAPPHVDPGAIDEVREVSVALDRAIAMLRERERLVQEALEREQRARQEAEHQSAAKDEFLAMLGHELRNPLNAITGANAVMQQVEPGSDGAARAREIIARQVVTLRELVDDLLDVARVTRGKIGLALEPLDLAQVARRVVSIMASSGRLAQHEVRIDTSPAWVNGDDTRLEQVVTNLLDNAVKYTPPGGRITVGVRATQAQAVLELSDSGVGMPSDLLPHVFDLFTQGERTLDRAQGGLGLGLALVRRLVGLHGGDVQAESEGSGRGSTFRVTLPLVPAPSPQEAGEVETDGERRLRILIVDDNADGRETLAMMLGLRGHEVHEAIDGPTAVEEALAWKPDAAIVDIGLPGFDGYEVARRIRAAAKGVAIRLVALTGYGQEDDRRQALAAGFDSFLVKPADFAALHTILATV